MADNDSNIIKPVENLQNILALTPTRRREHKKHRQQLHKEEKGRSEQEQNSLADEPPEKRTPKPKNDRSATDAIDYCA